MILSRHKRKKADKPATANLEVYETQSLMASQRWAWRLVASNGRIIATSGEGYGDRRFAYEMGWAICTGRYDITAVMLAK